MAGSVLDGDKLLSCADDSTARREALFNLTSGRGR